MLEIVARQLRPDATRARLISRNQGSRSDRLHLAQAADLDEIVRADKCAEGVFREVMPVEGVDVD